MASQFKSRWEKFLAMFLSKNGIAFEYEPMSFYLNHRLRYTPDFLLRLWQGRRRIIIEPHGIIYGDFQRFSTFRKIYGEDYFLILMVRNDDIPFVPKEAYDDIWPIEYAELLVKKLRTSAHVVCNAD
ncbi:MAG: hypothetical protein QXX08_10555 [Candidatus Bathyarchaeia archaeon]